MLFSTVFGSIVRNVLWPHQSRCEINAHENNKNSLPENVSGSHFAYHFCSINPLDNVPHLSQLVVTKDLFTHHF